VSNAAVRPAGTRERAKAERRKRLKDAALAVFAEKGFDAATTREIAERAGVGAATLFRYAREKRDLLLMIVNDDLTALNAEAFATLDLDGSLIDALLTLFRSRYAYWGANPQLAREAIHVTVLARADEETFESLRYRRRRKHLLSMIVHLIDIHQERGDVRMDFDAAFIAEFLLDVYVAHRRRWLADPKPDVDAGLASLRTTLDLAFGGAAVRTDAAIARRGRISLARR
jgi:AcrR family transcriptional regulator